MAAQKEELVLVTGGSGFLGGHCIIRLLEDGYRVRTTVRSLKRKDDVLEALKHGGAKNLDRLTFVEADLGKDEGWKEAVEGCTYVLHVASPFPPGAPKHEDELIIPAREGTLRVLKAARDAGVKRVVVTSSFAAIGYGHKENGRAYTEEDWTDTDSKNTPAYQKSKALAERAAWDFIEKEGGSLELAVVNPVGIFGPVLSKDFATSIIIVERLLKGDFPGCPQVEFGVVDVRDVADLEIRAMTNPAAKGQRFLAVSGANMSIQGISLALRKRMPEAAKKAPTMVLPNFLLRIASFFDKEVALVLPELGRYFSISNEKAKKVLGWEPRSNEDAVVATAESLIELKLV
jgi:nucleoside-diphosphate-sugar epimerase